MLLIVSGREFKLLCSCVCFISSYEGDVERKKKKNRMLPINTKQISDSWLRKQDSPHEGFCSPSQTPYSPTGREKFNVAQAVHPVLQTLTISCCTCCYTTYVYSLRLTLLYPYPWQIKTRPHKQTHLSFIYIHTPVIHKTDCKGHK